MKIQDILNKEFKVLIATQGKGEHWLLRNTNLPLYSTGTTVKGSDLLKQIADMEDMKTRLTEAQAGLVALLESED